MIRVLEDRVVNKIAAGEVVERPASALKELFENALDAGATELRVELERGGRELVRVADNGSGMDRSDATLCLERHATSKIRSDEDLFNIHTLGFRGEAVPSIAAVSRFELVTRTAAAAVGTRIRVEGGRLDAVEDAGCPVGTDISVRSLFFNIPVRKKFLRTVQTELSHCMEAVLRESLIRPELDVELIHDGERLLHAPRAKDRAARAADLLGGHGEALVPVSFQRGELELEGLISPVGVHKADAQGSSYLYVNGRFVRDPVLRKAVTDAYRGIVPKDRYPTVVLELRVPRDRVDVNVHPAKTEVRFQDARELVHAVSEGLREGLQRHGIHRPVFERRPDPRPPRGVDPFPQQALPVRATPGPLFSAEPPPAWDPGPPPAWDPGPPPPDEWAPLPAERDGPPPTPAAPASVPTSVPTSVSLTVAPAPSGRPPLPSAVDRGLLPVPRFADLRVLGQLARTYVLCEGLGELVIIDQHAAHERVTLHRLLAAERGEGSGGQRLLAPPVVELSAPRARALAEHAPLLAGWGLEVEAFGGRSFIIKQVPEVLLGADLRRLVEDVADDLAQGGSGEPARAHKEKVLATMACHTSVRAGQVLSPYEMRSLLVSLDQVDFSVCAHGRPVIIRVSPAELERRFHRS